jgi:hypothetical protein
MSCIRIAIFVHRHNHTPAQHKNDRMEQTTLIFLSWMELWTFHRSVASVACTILFKDMELSGDFSDHEIELAVRAMHARIKTAPLPS